MRPRDDIMLRNERAELAAYQPMAQGAPMMGAEPHEPSLIRALIRHFWLIVLFALIGAGGAYAFLKKTTPLYYSEAKIYIQPISNVPMVTATLGSTQRSNYLYTQAEALRSRPVLERVLENPRIKSLKTFEVFPGLPLEYLQKNLIADVGRKDDLLLVGIESPFSEDAAALVTAVVDTYINYQLELRDNDSTKVLEELKANSAKERALYEKIVAERDKYRTENPMAAQESAQSAGIAQIITALTGARIERFRLESGANLMAGNPQLTRAQKLEESLDTTLQEELGRLSRTSAKAANLSKLQAEVEYQEARMKFSTQRVNDLELGRTTDKIVNKVDIFEPATAATKPSFPRPLRTLAAAIVLGAFLGAGLALLRDRMDERMRSVEEIQTVVSLPILGVVPAMSGRRTAVARAMTVHLDPRSVVAEAYRTIRTAVYFGTDTGRCKTILVTSPEPGDGKTTSASNLAIAIAQTGRSVLLLDADFRKPSQHKNLDIKNSVGLSSVLAGREPIEHAIQRTGVDGLDILPCGPIPANPSEILNSREFGELIDALANRYDHILFDSPPVNAVTDARILGAVCDATILVLRADKSTRKSGEHARNALIGVGAKILGAVVNDAPKAKRYGVYGGAYYGSPDRIETHVQTTPRRPKEETKQEKEDEDAAVRRRNIA